MTRKLQRHSLLILAARFIYIILSAAATFIVRAHIYCRRSPTQIAKLEAFPHTLRPSKSGRLCVRVSDLCCGVVSQD